MICVHITTRALQHVPAHLSFGAVTCNRDNQPASVVTECFRLSCTPVSPESTSLTFSDSVDHERCFGTCGSIGPVPSRVGERDQAKGKAPGPRTPMQIETHQRGMQNSYGRREGQQEQGRERQEKRVNAMEGRGQENQGTSSSSTSQGEFQATVGALQARMIFALRAMHGSKINSSKVADATCPALECFGAGLRCSGECCTASANR